jgi:single-strand DNA-binding protein
MYLNKVSLIGDLIKDPVKKTASNLELSLFTLATHHKWKDTKTKEKRESIEFHSIVCFGNIAKAANLYLKKSSKVYLEGRLQSRRWEDKAGQAHFKTEILASNIVFLGDRAANKKARGYVDEVEIEDVPVIEYEVE